MQKILIIEDDIHINNMLNELLTQKGYETHCGFSGTEALLLMQNNNYSLMLLDLMLPGKTGEQVLEETRKQGNNIPIIVLTAKSDKESTVKLLNLGANDYIDKPFDNNELLARIAVQLRNQNNTNNLEFKDITLDLDIYDAYVNKKRAYLSKREFEILKLMISQPKKVFSKHNIYESIWGEDFFGDENTINVHISKLRSKLKDPDNPSTEYIETVWGIGFKMKE